MDFFGMIPGTDALGQPRLGSIYDEQGTPDSGYATGGPYHCEDCIHKTASDEPFCIHPKVLGDSCLQDQLVTINGRPAAKINLEHGCCRYVHPPIDKLTEDKDHE
jgi:hypothetical protein